MDACPPGFISISDAYEKIVQTLEPDARPGDDYLDTLLRDQGDAAFSAAFDNAVEAEKRAKRLLADALANKQLARGTAMVTWYLSRKRVDPMDQFPADGRHGCETNPRDPNRRKTIRWRRNCSAATLTGALSKTIPELCEELRGGEIGGISPRTMNRAVAKGWRRSAQNFAK